MGIPARNSTTAQRQRHHPLQLAMRSKLEVPQVEDVEAVAVSVQEPVAEPVEKTVEEQVQETSAPKRSRRSRTTAATKRYRNAKAQKSNPSESPRVPRSTTAYPAKSTLAAGTTEQDHAASTRVPRRTTADPAKRACNSDDSSTRELISVLFLLTPPLPQFTLYLQVDGSRF